MKPKKITTTTQAGRPKKMMTTIQAGKQRKMMITQVGETILRMRTTLQIISHGIINKTAAATTQVGITITQVGAMIKATITATTTATTTATHLVTVNSKKWKIYWKTSKNYS